MRRDYLFKVLMTLWAVWGIAIGAFAQQITVNGVVQDTQGEPIIGANILVKGTANGTITDDYHLFQLFRIFSKRNVHHWLGWQFLSDITNIRYHQ